MVHYFFTEYINEPLYGGYCDGRSLCLCYLSFLFGGSFGSAVGMDAVYRNGRRRRPISTDSNPTSAMNKCMDYISVMVVKTSVLREKDNS